MGKVDAISIEFSTNLCDWADPCKGGMLIENIANLRSHFADTIGLILPSVRCGDREYLKDNEYRILIKGEVVCEGAIEADDSFFCEQLKKIILDNADKLSETLE